MRVLMKCGAVYSPVQWQHLSPNTCVLLGTPWLHLVGRHPPPCVREACLAFLVVYARFLRNLWDLGDLLLLILSAILQRTWTSRQLTRFQFRRLLTGPRLATIVIAISTLVVPYATV
eukprot:Rmarinus@m.19664